MRHPLPLFLVLVSSVVAACGGKVVLDTPSSSGTGASGPGGAATSNSSVATAGGAGPITSSSSSGGCSASICPDPGTTCVTMSCANDMCFATEAAEGTACDDNGGEVCDGSGQCVECNSALDCPASSTACVMSGCVMSTCEVLNAPTGTACTDSGGTVCDGMGHCVTCDVGPTVCCLQSCETSNVGPYERFVGYELESCGCKPNAPCASACSGACADPSTLTAGSPCGMCLTTQTVDEMGSACTTSAGETCIGDAQCAAFVECALACP